MTDKIILKDGKKFIISFRDDGYVNATELCKAGGKEYYGWFRNNKTEEFLKELSSVLRIYGTELIKIKQGGTEQGTWVHPRVAIHIAQWVSPKFAVIVTGWIHKLLSTGNVCLERPLKEFSTVTEMDIEAEVFENKVKMEEFTTDSVIYISYIGKGMIKFTKHFLKKLEDLLSELGFVLRYEKGNFQSGYCLVEHRNILVVNKFFDTENRIQVILEIIQQRDNLNESLLAPKSKALLKNIKTGKLENLTAEEEIENKQTEETKN